MTGVASGMRREAFKVIVWGPGGLGSICIREICVNPAFELVGVRTYTDSKDGVDAGTLIGLEPIGLKASSDVSALLKIPCDCVLYTARDYGVYTTDDEIIQLLEAGKNVVTVLPYQYLGIARSVDYVARVQAACIKGHSTFHATGVNPCLIPDRVLLALTGLCNDIRATKLQEFWDASNVHPETLKVCGFGAPLEVAEKNPVVASIADNFLKQGLMSWAEATGVVYDRVVVEPEYAAASADIEVSGYTIKKGTMGRLSRRWCGYVDAIGTEPFMTVEVNWVMSRGMLPDRFAQAAGYQGWLMTIAGRPSIRTFIDIKADLDTDGRFVVPGDKSTDAGYSATVATLLQAVPHVCRAGAGVLAAQPSPVHWTSDMRHVVASGKRVALG